MEPGVRAAEHPRVTSSSKVRSAGSGSLLARVALIAGVSTTVLWGPLGCVSSGRSVRGPQAAPTPPMTSAPAEHVVLLTQGVAIEADQGWTLTSERAVPPPYVLGGMARAESASPQGYSALTDRTSLVRIHYPGRPEPLYGLLAFYEVLANAPGAVQRAYRVAIPRERVEQATGGLVSVVYQPYDVRTPSGETETFISWALWLSDAPLRPGAPTALATAADWASAATVLRPGFDRISLEVPVHARRISADRLGFTGVRQYFPAVPQHVLELGADMELRFGMNRCAALVIVADDGSGWALPFCEDVSRMIQRPFAAGRYRVYVGAHDPQARHTLEVTEIR